MLCPLSNLRWESRPCCFGIKTWLWNEACNWTHASSPNFFGHGWALFFSSKSPVVGWKNHQYFFKLEGAETSLLSHQNYVCVIEKPGINKSVGIAVCRDDKYWGHYIVRIIMIIRKTNVKIQKNRWFQEGIRMGLFSLVPRICKKKWDNWKHTVGWWKAQSKTDFLGVCKIWVCRWVKE